MGNAARLALAACCAAVASAATLSRTPSRTPAPSPTPSATYAPSCLPGTAVCLGAFRCGQTLRLNTSVAAGASAVFQLMLPQLSSGCSNGVIISTTPQNAQSDVDLWVAPSLPVTTNYAVITSQRGTGAVDTVELQSSSVSTFGTRWWVEVQGYTCSAEAGNACTFQLSVVVPNASSASGTPTPSRSPTRYSTPSPTPSATPLMCQSCYPLASTADVDGTTGLFTSSFAVSPYVAAGGSMSVSFTVPLPVNSSAGGSTVATPDLYTAVSLDLAAVTTQYRQRRQLGGEGAGRDGARGLQSSLAASDVYLNLAVLSSPPGLSSPRFPSPYATSAAGVASGSTVKAEITLPGATLDAQRGSFVGGLAYIVLSLSVSNTGGSSGMATYAMPCALTAAHLPNAAAAADAAAAGAGGGGAVVAGSPLAYAIGFGAVAGVLLVAAAAVLATGRGKGPAPAAQRRAATPPVWVPHAASVAVAPPSPPGAGLGGPVVGFAGVAAVQPTATGGLPEPATAISCDPQSPTPDGDAGPAAAAGAADAGTLVVRPWPGPSLLLSRCPMCGVAGQAGVAFGCGSLHSACLACALRVTRGALDPAAQRGALCCPLCAADGAAAPPLSVQALAEVASWSRAPGRPGGDAGPLRALTDEEVQRAAALAGATVAGSTV